MIARLLLPAGVDRQVLPLLIGRALRAFADGYVAVLLPVYLLALGLGLKDVGFVASATLFGSALATLAVGAWGHRFHPVHLLTGAAILMAATGVAFASLSIFWPLLLVAFIGTLNPSSGDVSVFLPLEQARLANASSGAQRTSLFARYSLVGSLFAAIGSLAAAFPEWLADLGLLSSLGALRGMFLLYGAIGCLIWVVYRRLPIPPAEAEQRPQRLEKSRAIVWRLALLFSVDSFAGGLAVNALLALWLFERFHLSLLTAGVFFFWTGLGSALSQLAAPVLAKRIGLLNTMVFTHIPASLFLVAAAFVPHVEWALALLLLRALLSQMDVPARGAFVMAVVTPEERAAAASFTAVPRSLAAAAGPSLGGILLAGGWLAAPLVACGMLKIAYDLSLWRSFKSHAANSPSGQAPTKP